MSRTHRFVWSALLSGGSIFISMAALLVVGKLVTTALPAQLVGFFALILLWSDFVNVLSSLGLTVSAPKLIAGAPEDQRLRIIRALLRGQGLLLVLATALMLLLHCFTPLQLLLPLTYSTAAATEYLWLLPLLFVPGTLRDLGMALLAGLNRYGARSAGIVIASLVQVAAVGAIVWGGLAAVETIALATAAGYACAAGWLLAATLRGARTPGTISASDLAAEFRAAVRFSGPLYANSLLTFVYQRLDTLLVTGALGLTGAGIFDMAKRIPALLSRVLGAFLIPYLPYLSEFVAARDTIRAKRLLHRALLLTGSLGYFVTFGVILVQEPLLALLFTREYLAAAPALGLLLAATCLAVQAGILGQTLIALGKPKWITSVNLFAALLSVALNLLLLPRLDLLGAGLAAVMAMIVSMALQAWLVQREGVALPMRPLALLQFITTAGLAAIVLSEYSFTVRLLVLLAYPPLLMIAGVLRWQDFTDIATALLTPPRNEEAP